ncbi:MAG: MG2 domain-containing protein [Chloroherpetonaceae bacterium]|nr:MG2 domain-containing protein [Chloroherpetonaceae bacterium]MDW8436826.1 alpha-2-macroglobulin family protein [Chloroherpetonaceae bacterium]
MRIVAVLACATLLATCAPKKSSQNFPEFEEGRLASLTTKEPELASSSETLEIVSATPQGEISSPDQAQSIAVMFNQPMIDLSDESQTETTQPILRIEPSVRGATRWIGSRLLLFTPKDSLPPATAFKVVVPKTLKSLSGKSLNDDYEFSFSTPSVRLVEHYPYGASRQLGLNDTLILKFNQKVDPSLASKIAIADSKGNSVKFSLSQKKSDELKALIEFYRKTDRYSPAYWFEQPNNAEKILFVSLQMTAGETYKLSFDGGKAQFEFAPFKPFSYEGATSFDLKPNDGINLSFSNPVSIKDLKANISFSPKIENPFDDDAGSYYDNAHSLYPPFKAATTYTATLSKNLVDRFGNKLGKDIELKIKVGDYSPRVAMPTGVGLIENEFADSSLYPSVPIRGMNISSAELKYAALSPDDVMKLRMNGDGEFDARGTLAAKLKSKTIEFENKRNESSIRRFDLREAFGGQNSGIAYLEVQSPSLDEEGKFDRLTTLVQVSSLGVSAKWSRENSLVFVTRLKDATPVANAVVRVYQSGKLVWSGNTNQSGVAEISASLDPSGAPIYAFVFFENQIAYTSSSWDYGIEPYRFGFYDIGFETDYYPKTTEGQAFTERGIYRAGETIYFKGVLREWKQGKWKLPTRKQVFVQVRNSKDEAIYEKSLNLSPEFGSFSDSLVTKPNAPLGFYSIQVKDSKNSLFSFASGEFRVEAYRPTTFETKISSSQKSFIRGEEFKATIEGRYLFGAPMIGDNATWRLTRSTLENFSFPDYDGYFWQPLSWSGTSEDQSSSLLASGSGTLDKLGQLAVSQKLDFNFSSPSMLTLEAEVISPSRQAVAERQSFKFHPAQFYIGLKPKTTFAKENSDLPVDVVTVSVDGKQVSQKASIEVAHRQWVSVKRAGVGGRYEWHSEQIDSVIFKTDVATKDAGAATFNVPIKGAGLYFIRASAKDSKGNVARSEAYVYAYGGGYSAWERFDDDRLKLETNKKTYKPNETATILVQSPYETATALLTIEREGILDRKVFELNGTAPAIEIPIKEDYLPNVYVSLMLVKGRTSLPKAGESDLGKPSFKIGYAKLSVVTEGKRLQVNIAPNKKEYRVGETVEVELDVKDANGNGARSEVTLAAVDAGVLNLIGYSFPDAFETFYRERGLGVKTSQSLLQLIEQRHYGEKGEARGGDKGGEGTGGFAFRQNIVATAHWNPSIITDANGKAKISFKLPDNLTTFRLMAFAHSRDCFGKAQIDITVSQPLSMIAALPRFARVGDTFEAGVTVSNYANKKTTVKVSVSASGIKSTSEPTKSVSLDANQSKEVRFGFAAETEGKAEFSFVAESDAGDRDAMKVSIPIQTPYVKEVLALVGSTESSVSETVRIPRNIYSNLGDITAQAASSALVGLSEAARYVFEYPYGCLEQKTSKILPYIVASDLISSFNLKTQADTAKGGAKAVVERTLAEFEKHQTYDGGFAYWQGGFQPNDYASVYATYAMLKANEAGYDIDETVLRRALNYLRVIINKPDESIYGYRAVSVTKAFALYALSLAGEFNASLAEKLYQDRSKLSAEAKSYLLRVYARQGAPLLASKAKGKIKFGGNASERAETLARELANMAKVQEATIHFEDGSEQDYVWTFGSNVKTTAAILSATLEANQDKAFAEKAVNWLLASQKNGRWNNTQDNVFALEALNLYFKKYESAEPNFTAKIALASQTLLERTFKGRSLDAKTEAVALDKFPKGENLALNIEKNGTGKLHYGIRLAYYPTYALQARDNGISLFKTIEPLSGRRTDGAVKAGDVVKITLQIAVPEEMTYVAVSDPLPAGLEAINPTLKTSGSIDAPQSEGEEEIVPSFYSFDHIELQDDRVTLFAERLGRGVHTYVYYARATTYGTFTMPPSAAEKMYQPEVFGRTGTSRLVVGDK